MIFFQKKQAGFSLVETLVAISILLIVIVGPMTISTRAAKSSSFATEQIQAFFLAQEGIELVEKARNDLLLANLTNGWTNFTDNSGGIYEDCYDGPGCGLEWSGVDGTIAPAVPCSPNACRIYRSDDDLNLNRSRFTHDDDLSNTATPFTRKIFLEADAGEVWVRSVVTWRTGSLIEEQRVEVDTYLYDLYETP